MMSFWKWLGGMTVAAVAAYAVLVALSTLLLPWKGPRFDTDLSTTTQPFWENETRYLMINKGGFATSARRVVVLGASNTREAFRPDLIEPRLPGWQVDMAGFGGANIAELGDAIDLIYDEMGERSHGQTVFVIGCYYLSFIPSAKLWPGGVNPVAVDAAKMGLYARGNDGRLTPRYPRPVERTIGAMLRPQAVMAHMPRTIGTMVLDNPQLPLLKEYADRTLRGKDPLSRWTEFLGEAPDLNHVTVPPDMKRALLDQRVKGAGGDHPLPPEQFAALERIIAHIRSQGDSVVIVNVPLPRWHIDGVPLAEASYEAGLADIVTRHAGDPHFGYLTLLDTNDDDNFFDSAHTKPRQWPLWTRRLAGYLRATVAKPMPTSR